MVHPFISTVAVILATLGPPGDPVGIDDATTETDLEPRQVSIEGARWEALRAIVDIEPPVVKPPGPWVADRQVLIERVKDGVRIRATWQLEALESGWWTSPLIGPMPGMRVESATWRGRDVGIARTPAGHEEVAVEMAARSRGSLELVAFIPADQLPGGVDGNLDIWLLPGVRGELRVSGPAPEGRLAELVADGHARRLIDGRFWAAEAQLSVQWVDAPQVSTDVEQPLAVAQTAMGLTFGDGEVRGRARVSWLLRRGQLAAVSIDSAGLGPDLEIAGPNVHEWARNGDRIDIVLKDAADGRIDVDLRWTRALSTEAEAKLAAPRIAPQQAYRTESFLQIARDGELEVVPELSGWSAVARAELPDWASGYIQGTATANYRRDGDDQGASFDLLRFVPVSGPPVLVDVAAYEIATTEEGRSLVQVRYDVRNERASHLRIEFPAGVRMLGVRVNGEAVTPARDAASNTEAWRIPLVRSLESVKGNLSFPVEVIFIGESDSWEKKEARELELPALDAPVAVSRVRVYLPPQYSNRVDVGDFHRVDSFSEGEGITYGLGVGVGSEEIALADELYREAVSNWMSNDFQRAQDSLDELRQLGASNMNIEGLQANLDLVEGRADSTKGDEGKEGQSAVVERRIRDQARWRAAEDRRELDEKAKEAEQLEAQGDYDKAEEKLAEAQVLGGRLAKLEQEESQEQTVYNMSLSSTAERVSGKKKRKVSRESVATKGSKNGKIGNTRDKDYDGLADTYDAPAAGPEGGEIAAPEQPPAPPPVQEYMDFSGLPEPMPEPEPISESETTTTYDSEEDDTKSLPVGATTPAKPEPNAPLAGPVAAASSVSVHIPAIGEAVLYQHMLLPEGQTLSVHLEARRHRKSKKP